MKSWAVPKGPSYDPAVKRLAMEVEDHPIEYNTFEGTIPKGQYGGGTVMLWDRGTYEPEAGGGEEALREGYERGDLKIVLHGKRLEGGWVLVRMRRGESGRAQWLLIKHRDERADRAYDVTAEVTTSVATGRTMEEIASNNDRVWNSNRDDDAKPGPVAKTSSTEAKRTMTTAQENTARNRLEEDDERERLTSIRATRPSVTRCYLEVHVPLARIALPFHDADLHHALIRPVQEPLERLARLARRPIRARTAPARGRAPRCEAGRRRASFRPRRCREE